MGHKHDLGEGGGAGAGFSLLFCGARIKVINPYTTPVSMSFSICLSM